MRAGTLVTCTAGHPVCRLAADLPRGKHLDVGDFTDWRIPPPCPAQRYEQTRCPCGAPFVRYLGGRTYLHTEQGWQPELPGATMNADANALKTLMLDRSLDVIAYLESGDQRTSFTALEHLSRQLPERTFCVRLPAWAALMCCHQAIATKMLVEGRPMHTAYPLPTFALQNGQFISLVKAERNEVKYINTPPVLDWQWLALPLARENGWVLNVSRVNSAADFHRSGVTVNSGYGFSGTVFSGMYLGLNADLAGQVQTAFQLGHSEGRFHAETTEIQALFHVTGNPQQLVAVPPALPQVRGAATLPALHMVTTALSDGLPLATDDKGSEVSRANDAEPEASGVNEETFPALSEAHPYVVMARRNEAWQLAALLTRPHTAAEVNALLDSPTTLLPALPKNDPILLGLRRRNEEATLMLATVLERPHTAEERARLSLYVVDRELDDALDALYEAVNQLGQEEHASLLSTLALNRVSGLRAVVEALREFLKHPIHPSLLPALGRVAELLRL